MRNAFGTDLNQAGLVDNMIGDAYDVVKSVAEALPQVVHVSQNLETIFEVSEGLAGVQAFIEDGDFITFLQTNMSDLSDLGDAYQGLYNNTVKLDAASSQVEGFVALGTDAPMIKQKVITGTTPVVAAYSYYNLGLGGGFDTGRILGYQVIVALSDGTRRDIATSMDAWFTETQLRLFCRDDAETFGNRPFTCLVTYTEEA